MSKIVLPLSKSTDPSKLAYSLAIQGSAIKTALLKRLDGEEQNFKKRYPNQKKRLHLIHTLAHNDPLNQNTIDQDDSYWKHAPLLKIKWKNRQLPK